MLAFHVNFSVRSSKWGLSSSTPGAFSSRSHSAISPLTAGRPPSQRRIISLRRYQHLAFNAARGIILLTFLQVRQSHFQQAVMYLLIMCEE